MKPKKPIKDGKNQFFKLVKLDKESASILRWLRENKKFILGSNKTKEE